MPKVTNPAPKNCTECGADITGRRGKACAGECRNERIRRQKREYGAKRYRERHGEMPWRKYLPEIRCLTCGGEIPKRVGVRTPTRCPVHQAEHNQKRVVAKERRRRFRRYGLTEGAFDALLLSQGDACAICRSNTPGDRRGGWHIDHDHSCCPTGESCGKCVRGILCGRCNNMIGFAEDDPEILRAAARYVRRLPLK